MKLWQALTKIVCDVLGVARSNLHERAHRPADWIDRRRNRRPFDDAELGAGKTAKALSCVLDASCLQWLRR